MRAPTYLPFNRKERFFTGTVLPQIIAVDSFAELHRLLDLCGMRGVLPASSHERSAQVQFLTEYGFVESAWFDESGDWEVAGRGRDTPDIVLVGPDWLLVLEAKVYAREGAAAINRQIAAQTALLSYWAEVRNLDRQRVKLVVLLPESYARELGELDAPVVTWEQVLDAYRDVAPAYWYAVLRDAMHRYDVLRSTATRGRVHVRLSGAEIQHADNAGSLGYRWVGRQGGPTGKAFAADIRSGAWRLHRYAVATATIENRNWWPIGEFLAMVEAGSVHRHV
jgi:hypothetical protein